MPIRDNTLIIREATAGTIVAAGTVISVELNGTALHGLAAVILVPGTTQGCAPKLSVTVHASTTSAAATTDPIIAHMDGIAEGAGEYILPFSTPKRAVCFAFDVSGGSTPGFSNVGAYISLPVGQKWVRTSEFR
jgi:hypothetical protein